MSLLKLFRREKLPVVTADALMAVIPTLTTGRQIDAAVQVASRAGILDEGMILRLRAEANSISRQANQGKRKQHMAQCKAQQDEYLPLGQKPDELAELGGPVTASFVSQISSATTQKQLGLIEKGIWETCKTTRIPHEDGLRNYLTFRSNQIGGKK